MPRGKPTKKQREAKKQRERILNEGREQEKKYIAWHVVAFLDLLGQQDKLREINALPNVQNEEEVTAFKQKIDVIYKPFLALKTFFKDSIEPFIKGGMDDAAFSPQEQRLLQEFRSTPISYRRFSDSLIVNLPLRSTLGKFPCHAIYGVLVATATTFLSCLANSWAIRGGIDVGLAIDVDDGEIYGPALARAYTLESRIAQYPRIVIGDELIRFLRVISAQHALTGEDKAHTGFAMKSLNLLIVDDDGYTILDWLGRDIREVFQHQPELVLSAYHFIIQESNKHKDNRDSKLGFRYTLLRDYVESRLPAWGLPSQVEVE
ncbi:MAG TPA: hypothetical protein VEF34_00475 [Syntrophobacteraceae bacterium]|nr:hypothetical protein [Syntrophobacteraceae bacterium]